MAENLNGSADSLEKDSKTLEGLAKEYDKATNNLQKAADTLEERSDNINSLKDLGNSPSLREKNTVAAAAPLAQAPQANGLALEDKNLKESLPAVDAQRETGTETKTHEISSALNGSSYRGRTPPSLKDKLRSSLGTEDNKSGAGSAKDAKSAFDDIFRKSTKSAGPKRNEAGVKHDLAGQDDGSSRLGFSLAAPETDQAVARLLGGSQAGLSEDKAIFGSIDETLFARISRYLRTTPR